MRGSGSRVRPRLAYAIAAVVLIVIAVVIAARPEQEQSRESEKREAFPEESASAYLGLCRARGEVGDNLQEARETFYSQAHSTLHVLAERLGDRDRSLAAALLESKNAVEASLAAEDPDPARAALDRLLDISRQALISLGVRPPSCSPPSG